MIEDVAIQKNNSLFFHIAIDEEFLLRIRNHINFFNQKRERKKITCLYSKLVKKKLFYQVTKLVNYQLNDLHNSKNTLKVNDLV